MQMALLTTVLKIPKDNFDGLISGQALATLPKTFLRLGQKFALCDDESRKTTNATEIFAWAECISCQSIDPNLTDLQLQQLTHLHGENLSEAKERKFLAQLRIYRLPQPIQYELEFNGSFAALSAPVSTTDSITVLSEVAFAQRKHQLEKWELSAHPELEELQVQISQLARANSAAQSFDDDLQFFMGWKAPQHTRLKTGNWIKEITISGNSSDGDLFEKRVRQSFVYLGFTNTLNNIKASLDPDSTGGAGGIDIYCEKPFPIAGECKASESGKVPGGVASQLNTLGQNHLGKHQYDASVKIIFAAGELTSYDKNAVIQNEMNVMLPQTLQRLVQLKVTYPGSINLRDLEECLRNGPFGESSDQKINNFISRSEKQVKLRANIAQLVKSCQEKLRIESVECGAIHTAYALSDPEHALEQWEIQEILVELSSPLAGYLGRTPNTDRFYFLRELQID